jgi:hypothetical protein
LRKLYLANACRRKGQNHPTPAGLIGHAAEPLPTAMASRARLQRANGLVTQEGGAPSPEGRRRAAPRRRALDAQRPRPRPWAAPKALRCTCPPVGRCTGVDFVVHEARAGGATEAVSGRLARMPQEASPQHLGACWSSPQLPHRRGRVHSRIGKAACVMASSAPTRWCGRVVSATAGKPA